ncbi:hypothetical protein F2Q70_00015097 [Brassica cretica]|uniref:PPIase cyclophilin-type domain-containing protein n=1 Tax=Brassica cretica TaxID=69181 RepID=A0A8S9I3E8_BRACR|nr:hypothetical protein F2Q70_00015097 [Brassica cretica]
MGNHVGQPNRSQFLLHSKEAPDYDEEPPHVAFGKVVSGFDVIRLVERMVGNEFVPFFANSVRVIYEKLLNQLRAAQLMGETEIAQAKQKIAYESEYDRAEALRPGHGYVAEHSATHIN